MTLSFNQTDGLTITFSFWEKVCAFHGDFHIPTAQVTRAWIGMPESTWREWRAPGSFIPGVIKAGTYYTPRGKEFWYVSRNKSHAVTIEIDGLNGYKRLVLGFESPTAATSSGLPLQN